MAGAGHVIGFHIVTEGSCWAEAIDAAEPPIHLRAGEIVAFPGAMPTSWPQPRECGGRPTKRCTIDPSDQQLPFSLKMTRDQGADTCRFVCGFLGCDARPFNPLLSALPRVIHAPISSASRGWLSSLLHVAVKESGLDSAGREAMLAKLAELMFVEVIRNHIRGLPEDARGWFAGLRDPHISAALRLIHGRPSEPWTLEGLAREIGLSRSAFAERFISYVEVPPMQYLGRWRLQIAARLLEDKRMSIAQVAAEVGYQSEAAFNRAFKKYIGTAPGSWRRERIERGTMGGS